MTLLGPLLMIAGALVVWSAVQRRGGGDLAGVDVIRALKDKEGRR